MYEFKGHVMKIGGEEVFTKGFRKRELVGAEDRRIYILKY